MPAPAILQAIARAYMERERQRVGIPQQEQAAAESETATLMRRAQAARIAQQLELAPAEQESEIALRNAHINAYGAQAEAARSLAAQRDAGGPPPNVGSFEDYVVQKYGARPTPEQITEARKVYRQAGDRPRMPSEGFAANPFNVTDSKGNVRLAVRIKGGGIQFVDDIGGEKVAPGPTADMRNVEYQAQAVEPAFDLVEKSLDTLAQASAGFTGSVAGMVPGTAAYNAKSRFQEQAKALLGAIVARQAGEGSRLSDEDRRAYSRAATLVNNQILLPGGSEEARGRLADARILLAQVIQRRRGGGLASPGAPTAPPAAGLSPNVQRILDMLKERDASQR